MTEAINPPGWNPKLTYSAARRAGDYLFLSGFTAADESGDIVHPGDIVQQTRAIYRKIESILRLAGVGLDSVVETTEFYIPDPAYKDTARVRCEMFKEVYPAATGIPVQSLIRKDALIEIKVVAYAPVRPHAGSNPE